MWRGWGLTLTLALVLSGGVRATDDDVLEEIQRERMRQLQTIRAREGKYGKSLLQETKSVPSVVWRRAAESVLF